MSEILNKYVLLAIALICHSRHAASFITPNSGKLSSHKRYLTPPHYSSLHWLKSKESKFTSEITPIVKAKKRSINSPWVIHSSKLETTEELKLETSDVSQTNKYPQNDNQEPSKLSEKALGALVLLTVPVSWGTFAPVVRYIYDLEVPIPGFVFSALYYIVASMMLLSINTFEKKDEPMPVRGGIELGTYLFIGNCLQVVGLETVPADRAAFLVQLTTVFVPLYQGFVMKGPISNTTWIACLLAFVGVITMGLDGPATESALSNFEWSPILSKLQGGVFGTGDFLVILAAVSYTLHVVRLDKFARSTTPIKLAAVKSTTEAILASSLVGVLLYSPPSQYNQAIEQFFQTPVIPPVGILCVLWTGIVTCGYTIYAQSFGQKRLQNPVYANLIYSSQPLFSALFAYSLLGEKMGSIGFLGGALIAAALGIVSLERSDTKYTKE